MPLDELDRIEISCVSDLVSFVRENAKRVYHSNVNAMTWYRGQENYEWHLSPAVYRDNQFQYESLYIKELERIRPAEFVNCSNFDKLVKMQHYGLPTRLLDVTSNPLVALFFACNSHREIDGALYCFLNSPTFWEDNWAVQIVTDYVMNPTNSINELIRRGKDRLPASLKNENNIKSNVFHALGVPAHAVLPKSNNQRIQMQSGAFLLFGMSVAKMDPNKVRVMDQSNYIQFCELDSSCEKMICPSIKKIRIPHQHKQRILEELDLLGINEGFLFPELEYQSKKVVQYVQNKN